ncbi:hypothetical protein JCM3765_005902 [Sporobolomyces pararoseus]
MPLNRQNAVKTLPSSDSLPTFQSNRPNRSSSKVSLKILLARGINVAGAGSVRGELEVSVKDKAIGLGEVGIELNGVEELRNRDHTATKRIFYSRLLFQGPGLPPSNAVVAGSSASQGGYFPALRGRTRFDFSFDLPKDLPSTCAFGANAVVRYELRAFASSIFEGDVDLKSEKKDVLVVERWDDWRKGNWSTGVEKEAEQELRGREGGLVTIKGGIGNDEWSGSLPRLFWWRDVDEGVEGKGTIEVRLRINNTTKRHIPGVKASLIRRLRLRRDPVREGPAPPQLSSSVTNVDFLGSDYDVRAGSEREVLVSLQLPKEECWSGRKGTLFDLDCFVRIQVEGGFLDPKLFLEFPVWIAHPFSISNTTHRLVDTERKKHNLQVEIPPSPSVPFLRSPRSNLDFSSPSPTRQDFSTTEVAQPHRLGLSSGAYHYAGTAVSHSPLVQPHSTPSPQPSLSAAPLPNPPTFYTHTSPEPYTMPQPQNGYVALDPSLPEITPSRFLGSLQSQQPHQVYVSPESTMSVSMGPSPSHSPISPAQYSNFPPPPSWHQQPPLPPLDSHPSRQHSPLQPLEPYSAMQRAHHNHQTPIPPSLHSHQHPPTPSAPATYNPELPSIPLSCPSPAPSARNHPSFSPAQNSLSPRTTLKTPPPASPSSQYRKSSPSSSIGSSSALQPLDVNALDTIGEDGESQAGTTKSQAVGPSALAALREDDDSSSVHSVRVGSSPRSTSVQDLEELVAEEERKHEEERRVSLDLSKTLPPTPRDVPKKLSSTPMRAQDIFREGGDDLKPGRPQSPSPSTFPTTSPSPQVAARPEGGLSALQARLARATSPVQPPRSPSPSKSSTRTVSPAPALAVPKTQSALRARSLSRSSRQRDQELEKALQEAEEDPAEVVKRALSKATWSKSGPTPPPNVSSEVFKAVTAMKSLEINPREEAKVTSKSEAQLCQVEVSQVRVVERPAPVQQAQISTRPTSPPSRPPSRPIFSSAASASKRETPPLSTSATPSPRSDLSSSIEQYKSLPEENKIPRYEGPGPKINEKGRKVVDVAEVKELKKDAVVRVGDWLQKESRPVAISPWSSLAKSNSSSNLPSRSLEFGRQAPLPPTPVEPTPILKVADGMPIKGIVASRSTKEEDSSPTVAQLLAAETRAELRRIESSRDKASPVAKGMNGFLTALKQDEEFESKPHSSSVRGGKGGKVSSVTSIWASREEGAERIPIPTSAVRTHKPTKSLSSLATPSTQPLSPVGNTSPQTKSRSLQVLAPVAAKPFLNTTLGRSTSSDLASLRSPSIASSHSSVVEKEQVKPTVVGGAKVKDLLARYQQQLA